MARHRSPSSSSSMERNVNWSVRIAALMLAGGRTSVERRRTPSEEFGPERLGLVRERIVVIERHAGVLRLDPGDPTPRAIEQFVLVVHEPSPGHEDAQVRPRVAVLAG